jgi:hypothetical protein
LENFTNQFSQNVLWGTYRHSIGQGFEIPLILKGEKAKKEKKKGAPHLLILRELKVPINLLSLIYTYMFNIQISWFPLMQFFQDSVMTQEKAGDYPRRDRRKKILNKLIVIKIIRILVCKSIL